MAEPIVLVPFDPTEAITLDNAAGLAGVTSETIRRWAVEHDLGRRIGGRWRVSRAALRMFLDGNRPALRAYHMGDRANPLVRPYLEGRP